MPERKKNGADSPLFWGAALPILVSDRPSLGIRFFARREPEK